MKERFYLAKLYVNGDVKDLYNSKVYSERELYDEIYHKTGRGDPYIRPTGFIEEWQLYTWSIYDANILGTIYSVNRYVPYLIEISKPGFEDKPDINYFEIIKPKKRE